MKGFRIVILSFWGLAYVVGLTARSQQSAMFLRSSIPDSMNLYPPDTARADSPIISITESFYLSDSTKELFFWQSPKQLKVIRGNLKAKHLYMVNGMIYTEITQSASEQSKWDDAQLIYHWIRGKKSLIITREPMDKPKEKPKEKVIDVSVTYT